MAELNYHHLRYFWAVAHDGNLSRTAQRLHVSQSALSVQIRKLEEQLGQNLLEREGRRLRLTEAGRIALDYADTVFAAGAELVGTLKGGVGQRRRVLRVGALTTLSRNFQLELLRPLIHRDDVELVIRSAGRRELLAQLQTHAVDLVLSNEALPRDAGADWYSQLVSSQPISVVGPPSADDGPLRFPGDLEGVRLVLPSLESGVRESFDRLLEFAGVRPVILAEVDDMAMLRLVAREGHAYALVPPVVVRDELRAGVLVERCRIPEVRERFYAIFQRRRFPNPLVRELLEAAAGRDNE
ncbi:LysR family transcriptional regulator [Arhodomonas sp. SL1]|uniref:LysR family transcriptional regulator n=1 Tax=Arhodomonas sp. SL1 TaxID=3425691 RepID=UPI003F88428F